MRMIDWQSQLQNNGMITQVVDRRCHLWHKEVCRWSIGGVTYNMYMNNPRVIDIYIASNCIVYRE